MAKKPASTILDVALTADSDASLATLADELLKAFGGPAQLARAYHAEFVAGKEGGMARQRLLEGVLRTIGQASNQKKEFAGIEMLPEDALGDELVALLRERGLVGREEEANGSAP